MLFVCRCCAFAADYSNCSNFQHRERVTVNDQNIFYASLSHVQARIKTTMVTTRSAAPGHQRVTWSAGGVRVSPDATVNNASTANKKSLASTANKKSSPAARRMAKKDVPRHAATRRSARLAKHTTTSDNAPISHDQVLPSDLAGASPGSHQSASAYEATSPDDTNPSPSINVTPHAMPTSDQDTDEPININEAAPVDEDSMVQYMMPVRTRIDALVTREVLIAAINAPFYADELHRDLLKEVVRLWIAISTGRVNDFHEALRLPLDDPFWTEEVLINFTVSQGA